MSSFADNLTYLRKRSGFSQQDLADRINISRSQIGMYETGQRMPSREVLELIADTFNVSIDFLVGRVDSGNYSATFRKNLSAIIANSDKNELIACGVNLYEADLIISGTLTLTFEIACELADQLGRSLDEMLGKEDPALMGESEVLSEITQQLLSLPDDKLQAAAEYIRYLSNSAGK